MHRTAPLLLLTLTWAGCQADIQQGPSPYIDQDNDGFPQTKDCDDENRNINPAAYELCNGVDDDCDGQIDEDDAYDAATFYLDADGDGYGDPNSDNAVHACSRPDGYATNESDCDDSDATSNPSGVEVCDGADNDCDGHIDEAVFDAPVWYQDADDDGYGSPYQARQACLAPSGYVEDDTDCNDGDDSIHPNADEVCNGVDDDCDGFYDDEDDDVTDPSTWWADSDGDGWGDAGDTVEACLAPSGYVARSDTGSDCDDDDPDVNPGTVEVCANGIDDDCDGGVDEEASPYPVQWYLDRDADGYGDPASPDSVACGQPSPRTASNDGDCNDLNSGIHPGTSETWYDGIDENCDGASDYDADADGHESDDYGGDDCDDSTELAHPGRVETCGDTYDNDCDGVTDPCSQNATFYGEAGYDELGGAVAGAGDWNGDGYDDFLMGADRNAGGGTGRGAAYLVVGPLSGTYAVHRKARATFTGEADDDRAGSSLAGLGDMNGDGFPEVAIGATGEDSGGLSAGAVYIEFGPVNGSQSLASATAKLTGEVAGDSAGYAVAGPGDVSGDDVPDLLVGAWGRDVNGADSGAVYLLDGPVSADTDLSFADTRFTGEAAGDNAGFSVAGGRATGAVIEGSDANGDGISDVLVGAPYASGDTSYTGAAYLVYGPVTDHSVELSTADAIFYGEAAGDVAGTSVAWVGDVDGDGQDDLVVGGPGNDRTGPTSGAAWLVSGASATGSRTLSDAEAVLVGLDENEYFGNALAGAGDVNLDGYDDIIVGARLADAAASNAGAAYVFVGPLSGEVEATEAVGQVTGVATNDWAGTSVAGAGDVNGDTLDDVILGIPRYDGTDVNQGSVVLVLGSW